jgi:hypothetical protein
VTLQLCADIVSHDLEASCHLETGSRSSSCGIGGDEWSARARYETAGRLLSIGAEVSVRVLTGVVHSLDQEERAGGSILEFDANATQQATRATLRLLSEPWPGVSPRDCGVTGHPKGLEAVFEQ